MKRKGGNEKGRIYLLRGGLSSAEGIFQNQNDGISANKHLANEAISADRLSLSLALA